jgi:hypothetical protein
LLRSETATVKPFQGGTICVAMPRARIAVVTLDALGGTQVAVPLTIDDFARPAKFQYWFRDGAHPDGTGAGLSNALSTLVGP